MGVVGVKKSGQVLRTLLTGVETRGHLGECGGAGRGGGVQGWVTVGRWKWG